MSGDRHSGLTQEEYEDRETLMDAMSVIEKRWPHREGTLELLRLLVGRIEGEGK